MAGRRRSQLMAERGRPRVAFFAATLEAGNGGIARVGRMATRALARLEQAGEVEAAVWSLLDELPPADLELPVTTCGGDRWRFVKSSHRAALTHTHFLYDHLGMARAHCRLPGLRRPFLSFIHGDEIWEGARGVRIAAARRADALLAISQHTRERAQAAHGSLERARICWLATDSDEIPVPEPPRISEPPRVLMVSRVEHVDKGHDLLVDCWPRVAARVSGARLTFAGRGQRLEQLRARIAASPAAGSIEALGFVPEEELESLYARSTAFAMPSRIEGFGLVYIEAMRHALPVIATVHDAGYEVNVDGETGFNVDLDCPDELPARLIELLNHPEDAAAMGARGRKRWARFFRYSAFESRFLALLKEFLATDKLGT